MNKTVLAVCVAAIACGSATNAMAGKWKPGFDTDEAPMMEALEGKFDPVLTVGEAVNGYYAPGKLDGIGAWRRGGRVQVVVNSELGESEGYLYELANGTQLRGARVSSFWMHRNQRDIKWAGLAYDTIYDRYGEIVTDAAQVNEGSADPLAGLGRLCSARSVKRGEYGFRDDIFFTGEEDGNGTEWALDARNKTLWAAPELGRASWESVSPVDTGDWRTIGLIIGDDVADAPLYYYVGNKQSGGFLERNGLADGQLYCWRSLSGELNPADFNGTGNSLDGEWVPLAVRDESKAGVPGYDAQGYLDGDTLRAAADAEGCFSLSRPEDVHENPADPTQVVVASTGRSRLYRGADTWGTLYIIDVDSGELKILLDSDEPQFRDFGIRSPDNLTWADNGLIYVQEDRSTGERVPKDPAGCDAYLADETLTGEQQLAAAASCRDNAFGGRSEVEASLWVLDPSQAIENATDIKRIAVVDRSAVPASQYDSDALDLGDWETSGILDVTRLFRTDKGETLLIGAVQGHSLRGGTIESENLDEGGQLFFLSFDGEGADDERDDD